MTKVECHAYGTHQNDLNFVCVSTKMLRHAYGQHQNDWYSCSCVAILKSWTNPEFRNALNSFSCICSTEMSVAPTSFLISSLFLRICFNMFEIMKSKKSRFRYPRDKNRDWHRWRRDLRMKSRSTCTLFKPTKTFNSCAIVREIQSSSSSSSSSSSESLLSNSSCIS